MAYDSIELFHVNGIVACGQDNSIRRDGSAQGGSMQMRCYP